MNDNRFVWPKTVQNYHIQIVLSESNGTVLFHVGFIPIIVLEQETVNAPSLPRTASVRCINMFTQPNTKSNKVQLSRDNLHNRAKHAKSLFGLGMEIAIE